MTMLERTRDFLMLRPICGRRFLQVVWFGYLAVEVVTVAVLLVGTYQLYPIVTANLLQALLSPVAPAVVRIGLVRVFLETAASVLGRTGDRQS